MACAQITRTHYRTILGQVWVATILSLPVPSPLAHGWVCRHRRLPSIVPVTVRLGRSTPSCYRYGILLATDPVASHSQPYNLQCTIWIKIKRRDNNWRLKGKSAVRRREREREREREGEKHRFMFAQDDHEVGVDVDHVDDDDDDDQDDGKGRQWRAHLPMQHHTLSLCGRIDLTGSANDCVCVCVCLLLWISRLRYRRLVFVFFLYCNVILIYPSHWHTDDGDTATTWMAATSTQCQHFGHSTKNNVPMIRRP